MFVLLKEFFDIWLQHSYFCNWNYSLFKIQTNFILSQCCDRKKRVWFSIFKITHCLLNCNIYFVFKNKNYFIKLPVLGLVKYKFREKSSALCKTHYNKSKLVLSLNNSSNFISNISSAIVTWNYSSYNFSNKEIKVIQRID